MNKFENVDLVDSLRRIMETNTAYYQSDFNFNEKKLCVATISDNAENKGLLVMSRRHGTYLFSEAEVFKKGTFANATWQYYSDQPDSIIAYVVKVKGMENCKVAGDLYELDYTEYVKHVGYTAVDAYAKTLHYEHGNVDVPAGKTITNVQYPKFGCLVSYETKPNDPQQLKAVLADERRSYEVLKPEDIDRHISKLSRGKQSIRKQLSQNKSSNGQKNLLQKRGRIFHYDIHTRRSKSYVYL